MIKHMLKETALAYMQMHRLLTKAQASAGSRRLADGPTAAELALEADFAADLESALADTYRYPLRGGIGGVPEGVDAARDELLLRLDDVNAQRPLLTVLARYTRQAANVGGQMGLDELEAPGVFNLTDPDLLAEIDGWSAALVDVESDISLTYTTADELARRIERERQDGKADSVILAGLGLWINARSLTRSVAIANTESVRITRQSMLWTYAFNGINGVFHRCEPDVVEACTTQVCVPLCGNRYAISSGDVYENIPGSEAVPLHPYCRCWYEPDRGGWLLPALIWTGFAISLLDGE